MTFADLKAALDTLTPEQLSRDVVWTGDERGGIVKRLWVAEEDWVENDGDCEPLSVIVFDPGEDPKSRRVFIPKGTPQLVVD